MVNDILKYARDKEKEYLKQLFEFLSIPSISTLPKHKQDVRRAAEWLENQMKKIGLENVKIMQTGGPASRQGGHPVVYGDWLHAKNKPTVLFYGHYDVQPADPLDEWTSPPFKPEIRTNNIYARGASDNKGQHFIHLKSVDSFMETAGRLPVNVKFLIEGEEESGSANLEDFIKKNKKLLNGDIVFISDTGSPTPKQPAIFYGLRGLLYTEITVQTAKHDLHSGGYGGAVENPTHVLSRIISELHDDNQRITIPGFYDDVLGVDREERELWKETRGEKEILKITGAKKLINEKGYSPVESKKIRPTLDVNGIWGGFSGEGAKTIIPSKAHAKISMRLVPNQNPGKIAKNFEKYLAKLCPDTANLTFRVHSMAKPVVVNRNMPYMAVAKSAVKEVFGVEPFFNRLGGTIPVVEIISRVLGLQSILLGFGLDDDNNHAPNEKLSLEMWKKGVETSIRFLQHLGVSEH